ncbi:MAG: hypothetical protein V4507_08365 [Verrucomicrobiota bacterium]
MERTLYFGIIVACYIAGRWQGENRELVHRALRAKEFASAINENRIDDIQYRLQDDANVAAYNSYNQFSFGPDLWQPALPHGPIQVTFNKTLAHAPTNGATPTLTPVKKPVQTSLILQGPTSAQEVKETSETPKTEAAPESVPAPAPTPAEATKESTP